jgi:hypothetical protein
MSDVRDGSHRHLITGMSADRYPVNRSGSRRSAWRVMCGSRIREAATQSGSYVSPCCASPIAI